ncbi:tRNA glutamyl-Q(34) synthetase GluQRS [Acetobacter sp. DsW_063]|uniref:tRNA glutamyl-Q(34) synthetase GluQRS n=1 Tax=Acetobacter sp. DsW_063 TaxID=1514894 RepID=UPI000A37BA30|nr:tRNA glutamyl-Q(34) synthetase GluQRS [Acetobacter sp. DsW_063]
MASVFPFLTAPTGGWTTRFAPSPTGLLHLGHVAAALFAHEYAEPDGRFLLRIEDIDTQRCQERFIAATLEDLGWLGLRWRDAPMRQSQRMDQYRATLDTLQERDLLYPCFCTRTDIAREAQSSASAPHTAPDGGLLYAGTCRNLSATERAARIGAGQLYALRLDMRRSCALAYGAARRRLTFRDLKRGVCACEPEAFGDVILARRDTPASYHLCVTHDDAAQGVTLVTRGEDLRSATDVHRLLQTLMGWPEPLYAFHPLLCDQDGKRLAKRDGALSIRAMRESGMTPEELIKMARLAKP